MKLFIFHQPTAQGFILDLYKPRFGSQEADTSLYERVRVLDTEELLQVPEIAQEVSRILGDLPHHLDIQTTWFSELSG